VPYNLDQPTVGYRLKFFLPCTAVNILLTIDMALVYLDTRTVDARHAIFNEIHGNQINYHAEQINFGTALGESPLDWDRPWLLIVLGRRGHWCVIFLLVQCSQVE
jgi:hypothetical protein